MKKNIEIYEDNGGNLHLCILDETGSCVAVYGNWVDNYAPRGILIDACKQMKENPNAYQLWEGNELDDIDEDLTVEYLYKSLSEADLVAWTDEAGELRIEEGHKIGYAGRKALGIERYFVVDSCLSKAAAEWSEMLETYDESEAISTAQTMWAKLSDADQKRRDDFFLACALEDPDNEGYPDYDTADIIWSAF